MIVLLYNNLLIILKRGKFMKKLLYLICIFCIMFSNALADKYLTWDESSSAEYYTIFCREKGSEYWEQVWTSTDSTTTRVNLNDISTNNGPLQKGVEYEFTIQGFNNTCSQSMLSDAISFTYIIPQTLNIGITNSFLTWTSVSNTPISNYILKYHQANSEVPLEISIPLSTSGYDLCSINFIEDVEYNITMVAVSIDGVYGEESNVLSYTRRSVSPISGFKVVDEVVE